MISKQAYKAMDFVRHGKNCVSETGDLPETVLGKDLEEYVKSIGLDLRLMKDLEEDGYLSSYFPKINAPSKAYRLTDRGRGAMEEYRKVRAETIRSTLAIIVSVASFIIAA